MRISIITVVYNGVKTIEQTIKSVLNQKYDDIEYIVIDGLSNDGTVEIIKKYDDSIAYWISEKDDGIYDAMNKGVEHATGDIVAFINSDDWYENNVIEQVCQEFDMDKDDIVYGKVKRIKNTDVIGYVGIFKDVDIEELHYRNLFCHQGMFIKKSIFNDIGGFDVKYKAFADYEWNLRAMKNGKRFRVLSVDVANFRVGGVSSLPFACEEFYEIAKRYSEDNYERMSVIQSRYEIMRNRASYNELKNKNIRALREVLSSESEYLVWGTGDDGEECYEMLERLNYNIIGFVDNYVRSEQFHNTKVYGANEIIDLLQNNRITIIVAATSYEKEIVSQLVSMNIKGNYVTFSDILDFAGKKLYSDYSI